MEAADYEARAAQLRHVADVARAGGGAGGVAEVRPSKLLHCSVTVFRWRRERRCICGILCAVGRVMFSHLFTHMRLHSQAEEAGFRSEQLSREANRLRLMSEPEQAAASANDLRAARALHHAQVCVCGGGLSVRVRPRPFFRLDFVWCAPLGGWRPLGFWDVSPPTPQSILITAYV